MLTYATGRTLVYEDRPAVDAIVTHLSQNGYGLQDLVALVATSKPFLSD
jgi:hypothetical protein